MRVVANACSQLMPDKDILTYQLPKWWLRLDLGLDSGLIGVVFKDARGFVSNAPELALDPLGCARGLCSSVSSALMLRWC